ncbi:DUF1439 domain-containing protein [Inhella sp.]|uniref:DUF1439 domain-containing protein n=1 Tax=Inhella sp. TaxID=1921806 RepID=UPI0035AD909C
MFKRILLGLVLLLLLLAVARWAIMIFSPDLTVDLTQAQLQAQLDPKFPKQECLLKTNCLELREPKLELRAGSDRIAMRAQFVATLGKRSMPGRVVLSGKPRYEASNAAFYLDAVEVSEFEMSGNAPDFDQVVKVRGPKLMAAIVQNVPLYRLKSDSRTESLAKLALRGVAVVDGKLRVRLVNPLGLFEPPA